MSRAYLGALPTLPEQPLEPVESDPHREDCPAYGTEDGPCCCAEHDRDDRLQFLADRADAARKME